jgi:protein-tyrosine phosphatase
VLHGIDDGPPDLAQSLSMLRTAAESGTATIASTPHLRPDFPDVHVEELADRCSAMREAIAHEGIQIELVSGAEVSLVWAAEASDEELALASYGQRGTDLLIETPRSQLAGVDRVLFGLQTKGYRITLGHPERSAYFQRDDDPLRAFVEHGNLLQVNAGSLLRSHSDGRVRRFATKLVSQGLVHAIASDGHRGSAWRPVTLLADGVEEAAELVGPARARWMAHAAPAAIVTGAALPDPPPAIEQRRRRLPFGLGRSAR